MTREEIIKGLGEISVCQIWEDEVIDEAIKELEQEPKTGHCKDCKWWKDSDGFYRRGGRAESHCPINRREVFEGNGYCYMFEPQERGDKE